MSKAQGKQGRDWQEQASSPGTDSPSVTPKDISPDDAAAKDTVVRKTTSADPDEREQALLDDAVDLTFPASDPIAIPTSKENAERSKAGRP